MKKFGFFECKFCNQRYVKEAQYNKHTCELLERDKFVTKTKRGRHCFTIYKLWIKARGYREQGRDTFIESRYYNSILKFAEFYAETMLPDLEDYIAFMVEEQFLPQMWVNATVYERYMLEFDNRVKPLKQADITFKFLDIMAEQLECTPAEIFDYIHITEVIKLVRCRRLSPWVLIPSQRFQRYMRELDPEEQPAMEAMLNEDVWLAKFRKWPKTYKTIRQLTKELGI